MNAEVDISRLAIDRGEVTGPKLRRQRHVVGRYLIPAALVGGFAALVLWAAWDSLLPPQPVWVVPVLTMQSQQQIEGTPLFQAAGWIEPRPTPVRVAALAPGVVERLLVVEDQAVQEGEVVAQLVKADAQLSYEKALADLKLSQAQLHEVQAVLKAARTRFEQPVHLQADLGEAEASLAQIETELNNLPFATQRAEADLEFAETDYQGKKTSEGAVAGRLIDQAKSNRDSAVAMVNELRSRSDSLAEQQTALVSRRDALKTQLELLADEIQAKESSEARVEAAQARVELARVALAEAKLRLDRMDVRSPIEGRVYKLVAFPGANISAGMGPAINTDGSTVVTLYRPESLQIRVDVRFEDLPKVSLGQPVVINNPAFAKPLPGKVLFVSSQANIQKNTLDVKVVLDKDSRILKPEMLVDITFLAPPTVESQTAEAVSRLYIPEQTIVQDEGDAYVWLVEQSEGIVSKRSVTIGQRGPGGLIEVSGLATGSRVVARGQENLDDGCRIRVMGEETAVTAPNSTSTSVHQPMNRLPAQGH